MTTKVTSKAAAASQLACLVMLGSALLWLLPVRAQTTPTTNASSTPDIAFYYQKNVPVDLLKAFSIVVLDPSRAQLPAESKRTGPSLWFARLRQADLTQAASHPKEFFQRKIAALQSQGYVGFLLDDGQPLGQDSSQSNATMVKVLANFAKYFPTSQLLLRNHLGIARLHAAQLKAVVVDGLYAHGPVRNTLLGRTPTDTRQQALKVITALHKATRLNVVGLDYCQRYNLACRRKRAKALHDDGLIPYVTDPAVSLVGVGNLEVLPRTVLMVQNDNHGTEPLGLTDGARLYTMPLNELGYTIQYADTDHLPTDVTKDQYAGIVVALDTEPPNPRRWRHWLLKRIKQNIPVAVLGDFGFDIGSAQAKALGLVLDSGQPNPLSRPKITYRAPMMGFEIMPAPDPRSLVGFHVGPTGHPLLSVQADGQRHDAAGLLPWGGYALGEDVVTSANTLKGERWVIQPLDFFRKALHLPTMPIPVVTTENGVRLLFVHIDGDGFASRAEFPGTPFSPVVLRNQILEKYPIPHTVSVIQGEISRDGLHPKLAPKLEALARQIFTLPNVELASHTFSHPFNWYLAVKSAGGPDPTDSDGDPAYLPIPGYTFNVNKEIKGSIDYINSQLAPPGKHVLILQWPGDAAPTPKGVAKAWQAGVLNINGGDTTITRSNDSWTAIAPIGVAKGPGDEHYQVYVGTMNENVYTDDWNGPFYGYRRAVETFSLTNKPIRFKPLNIYYHFYSATKEASLKALKAAYAYALKEPVFPIYTSEYIRRVLDWRHVAVARKGNQWVIQSGSWLRELRWPTHDVPKIAESSGISGYNRGPDGTYVHMGNNRAVFSMVSAQHNKLPRIEQAAGVVTAFSRHGASISFRFGGYYKPFVLFKNAKQCTIIVDGKQRVATGPIRVSGTAAKPIREHEFKVTCG